MCTIKKILYNCLSTILHVFLLSIYVNSFTHTIPVIFNLSNETKTDCVDYRMKTFFHFPWCKSFPLTFLLFVISYHWWGWTTGAINWSGYQIKWNHLLNWVPIWSRLDHKTSPPNKEMYFNFIPNLIQCPTNNAQS